MFRANNPFERAPYIRAFTLSHDLHGKAPSILESNAAAHYTPGLGTLNAYAVVGQVDTVHGQVCHQGLC